MKFSMISDVRCPTSRDATTMKRKNPSLLGAIMLCALTLPAASAPAWAEHEPTCTLKTLKGRYLFATSGTIVPPAFGVSVPTPGASAGFHVFNGDGTGTDTVTLRVNGVIFLSQVVVPIAYTVNADCTGAYRVLIPNGPTFDLFIAPNGDSIATIGTDPGNEVSSIDPMVSSK